MAQIARVVCSGIPHHVTQRANRRQPVFFGDDDYLSYIELMGERCQRCDVDILAWCLMPNHVHLVAVPQTESGLARVIGKATAAIPEESISGQIGAVIYGRSVLPLSPWMNHIY